MSNVGPVFEELRATVLAHLATARPGEAIDALELRRTLNELAAELHAGKPFEEALALASRSPEGLGPEDPPIEAPTPTSIRKPRPALVSAAETYEERHARQRALFEDRQRRAEAARPAPKVMPPKAPIRVAQVAEGVPRYVDPSIIAFDERVLAALRLQPRTAYDLSWTLEGDPSMSDIGVSLLRLKDRGLVEMLGRRGRAAHWRAKA